MDSLSKGTFFLHAADCADSARVWRPFRRLVLETSGLAEAFLEQALRAHAVAATIDAVIGGATLDRFPEATAQAACADRLVLTKTDLATPSPQLLDRFAALNPTARADDAATVAPASLLFAVCRARVRVRGWWQRRSTRTAFAPLCWCYGGPCHGWNSPWRLADWHLSAARKGRSPIVRQGRQRSMLYSTLYPPRWLDSWPDADPRSRRGNSGIIVQDRQ